MVQINWPQVGIKISHKPFKAIVQLRSYMKVYGTMVVCIGQKVKVKVKEL